MGIIKFEDFSIQEEDKVIKVKETEPYGGLYSDPNGMKFYKDDSDNIYCKVEGVWHTCTEEGEPDCPIHAEIVIDEPESTIANEAAQKFTKSSAGMISVGSKIPFKTDVKIKKAEWDAMLTKINNMPSTKRADVIKKLHGLGLM